MPNPTEPCTCTADRAAGETCRNCEFPANGTLATAPLSDDCGKVEKIKRKPPHKYKRQKSAGRTACQR